MTTRLTVAEWRAVVGAVALADEHGVDTNDPESRRAADARNRAFEKIRDTLTTPATRRKAFP